jgi:hypothetical protein
MRKIVDEANRKPTEINLQVAAYVIICYFTVGRHASILKLKRKDVVEQRDGGYIFGVF